MSKGKQKVFTQPSINTNLFIKEYPGDEQVALKVVINVPGQWFENAPQSEKRKEFRAEAVEFCLRRPPTGLRRPPTAPHAYDSLPRGLRQSLTAGPATASHGPPTTSHGPEACTGLGTAYKCGPKACTDPDTDYKATMPS
ncbi:hypothetical protein CYMTET_7711 [Cymbomonas tetramitiformis]|uniref:Uncharacterized protein n=1 Tax=Cymbomonas tetramitiformis TaxID=36881 RepID=A0AAE0GV39_9CHLO|nr:hypothetical protein CYMTET_7711 [Cymbomonas tetramitiformis]